MLPFKTAYGMAESGQDAQFPTDCGRTYWFVSSFPIYTGEYSRGTEQPCFYAIQGLLWLNTSPTGDTKTI
jgi:hypothetical protein